MHNLTAYIAVMIASLSIVNGQDTTYVTPEVGIRVKDSSAYGKLSKALDPSFSISGKQLRDNTASQVSDVLERVPGVFMKDYGGLGGLKTISVRSLGATHTLMLVNGMPVRNQNAGLVDLGMYSVNNLSEISLIKGVSSSAALLPAAAYARQNALLLTYRQQGNTNTVRAGVDGGSFGRFHPFAAGGIRVNDRLAVQFSGEYLHSDGDYPYELPNAQETVEGRRHNADASSAHYNIGVSYALTEQDSLQLHYIHSDAERGLPGAVIFYGPESSQRLTNRNRAAQVAYEREWNKKLKTKVFTQLDRQYLRYEDPDFLNASGGLDNVYEQGSWFSSVAAGYSLLHNLELRQSVDVHLSSLGGNQYEASRHQFQSYTGLHYGIGRWKFKGGVVGQATHTFSEERVEDLRLLPALSVGVLPFDHFPLRFRASYKASVRQPAFSEMFFQFVGNPDLLPEQAKQWNTGLTLHLRDRLWLDELMIESDAFHVQLEDKILAIPTQNLFVWSIQNLGFVNTSGLEAGYHLIKHWGKLKWHHRLNMTWQYARNVNERSPHYQSQIPYTPYNLWFQEQQLSWKGWGVKWNTQYTGFRYALNENVYENALPAWTVHNLFLQKELRVANHWTANASFGVHNILDTDYQVINNFPMPGRYYILRMNIIWES